MKYGYTAEEKAVLWLDSFEELTYRHKQAVLSLTDSAVEAVTRFFELEEKLRVLLPPEALSAMRRALNDGNYLPSLLSNLAQRDIFFVTFRSADYPKPLLETPAPPLLLYCKGNRSLLGRECFAVVGSRRTPGWARALAGEYAGELSRRFAVVSGLAEGGDAAALQGVLRTAEGPVPAVSVLAYGMDHVYPAMHAGFLKELYERGLVVTEHRLAVRPQKYLFPVRNRIIAGLSKGVLVVSGNKKSGTSITAGYALEYGRDVFAFPYNPGVSAGEGCNALIKSGAFLADGTEDILSHYGACPRERSRPALTAEEERLFVCLSERGEAHVEELSRLCELPVYLLGGLLSGLEVKGYAVRAGGNRYAAVGRIGPSENT